MYTTTLRGKLCAFQPEMTMLERTHRRAALTGAVIGGGGLTAEVIGTDVSAGGTPRPGVLWAWERVAAHLPGSTDATSNPASGFPASWGLTRHDLLLIGAGLLIAALLLIVLVLRVRRRHKSQVVRVLEPGPRAFPQSAESWRGSGMLEEPTGSLPKFQQRTVVLPTPEIGWHPVQGDRSRIAYWDGNRWAGFRQWNGEQWVEPTASNS